MLAFLKWIDARLGEPSTYAGIAALLTVCHVTVDAPLMQAITFWGAAVAGILSVIVSEAGTKSPSAIAVDVLKAIATLLKETTPPKP